MKAGFGSFLGLFDLGTGKGNHLGPYGETLEGLAGTLQRRVKPASFGPVQGGTTCSFWVDQVNFGSGKIRLI